jgi:hypothetical protein
VRDKAATTSILSLTDFNENAHWVGADVGRHRHGHRSGEHSRWIRQRGVATSTCPPPGTRTGHQWGPLSRQDGPCGQSPSLVSTIVNMSCPDIDVCGAVSRRFSGKRGWRTLSWRIGRRLRPLRHGDSTPSSGGGEASRRGPRRPLSLEGAFTAAGQPCHQPGAPNEALATPKRAWLLRDQQHCPHSF